MEDRDRTLDLLKVSSTAILRSQTPRRTGRLRESIRLLNLMDGFVLIVGGE